MRIPPALWLLLALPATASAQAPTNVIVFLADDLGYGDVGPYDHDHDPGTPLVTNTPNLDQLASEGVRMTRFYANSPVCSPTRAAVLTGRHSIRSGITGVFTPGDPSGLPPSEVTIAEMLEPLGYRTGVVGKWHLGEQHQFLPLQQGFDEFYGVPYSNNSLPLFMIQGNTTFSPTVQQELLTQNFTTQAKLFIDGAVADDEPFFLFLPYTAPHVPLYVSPPFSEITGRGMYADCVYEMDWSIGQVVAQLDLHGIADDTLVMFLSDNGTCNNAVVGPDPGAPGENDPWRWACGSNLPFSGFKFEFLEGGLRVPFIARWPGVLPENVTRDTLGSVLDLLPTIATVTGATPPLDRPLDGEDLFGVLTVDAPRALDELHFYSLFNGAQWGTRELRCTRRGTWKQYYDTSFFPGALFNVEQDPGETTSLVQPSVAKTLWDRSRDFDCRLDEPRPWPDPLNLASWQPMSASSSITCATSSRAVDSDLTTGWQSGSLPSQQLTVDLGAVRAIQRVILDWGEEHATTYALSASPDSKVWTREFITEIGNGARDVISLPITTRYLRLECTIGPGVGYDLRELRVQAPKLPDPTIYPAK